jgi:phospholipid/cholesterol/gamma-HCH transport system substrate-binding protein
MITRGQKIRLGVFVAFALVVLFSLFAAVVGSSLWEKRDTYQIHYDISVSGLEIGAPVKYNGVRVGRVERIWIDPKEVSRTVVSISLTADTPLKENTRALLNVFGITGLRFIELVGGTSDAAILPPGSLIQAGTSVMDKLTGQAETISIKAELLINQLLALTGDENRTRIANVLERAGGLASTMDRILLENTESLGSLFRNASIASERLPGTLDEVRRMALAAREAIVVIQKKAEAVLDEKKMGAVMDETRATLEDLHRRVGAEELGKLIALLGQLAARTDSLVEKLDLLVSRSREDLQATFRSLTEATENMRDFSRLIREDPSRLIRVQERRERVLP